LTRSADAVFAPPNWANVVAGRAVGIRFAALSPSFWEAHPVAEDSELLLIGGRSGVGKSTVAFEISAQLAELRVTHAVIEGDLLDLCFPPRESHRLLERNLAALWGNYLKLGYRRLVYTNTVSVLFADRIASAMGGTVRVVAVL
jgi:hypothetical protein